MHPMLFTAIKAARRAGDIITRASRDLDRIQVLNKGPKNYVTEVDRAVEQTIIEILSEAYPDHAFLGEESGEHQPDAEKVGKAGVEYQWVIDPLDGTTNFIHGFPHYAVSIAALHRGQVMHAVVFDPNANEIYTASRGNGAFLDDRRIRVSSQSRYHDALIAARVPGLAGKPAAGSRFTGLLTECASVRRTGSTVLDLVYVASGRLDGYCATNLQPWDMAAGALIATEAGALVGDLDGEQSWYESGSILAATPRVFPQMIRHLQE